MKKLLRRAGAVLLALVVVASAALAIRHVWHRTKVENAWRAASPGGPTPTVRQVDHLLIQTPQPDELFAFLSRQLGLPVAWPIREYGGVFTSGGVSAGNVNLEVLRAARILRLGGWIPDADGLIGLAFQPAQPIVDTIGLLDSQGIPHGAAQPFATDVGGVQQTLWTNLEIERLLPGSLIFYCQYAFNEDARRTALHELLVAHGGGPLGIESLGEIVVGYTDDEVLRRWQALIPGVADGAARVLDPGAGPVLRLVKAERDALLGLVLQVRSLEAARQVLEKWGLLGAVRVDQVTLAPRAVAGVDLTLRAARP